MVNSMDNNVNVNLSEYEIYVLMTLISKECEYGADIHYLKDIIELHEKLNRVLP